MGASLCQAYLTSRLVGIRSDLTLQEQQSLLYLRVAAPSDPLLISGDYIVRFIIIGSIIIPEPEEREIKKETFKLATGPRKGDVLRGWGIACGGYGDAPLCRMWAIVPRQFQSSV